MIDMTKKEPTKISLGAYEVCKVEKKDTETEDSESLTWKYTLENKNEGIKCTISTSHEIEALAVKTKDLAIVITEAQSKLDV